MTHERSTYYQHKQSRSFLASIIPMVMKLMAMKHRIGRDLKRAYHNQAEMPSSFKRKFIVKSHEIDRHIIWTISPKSNSTDQVVLYLHGGAYLYGLSGEYWTMIEEMIHHTKATYIIPDYPLVPEFTATDVHGFVQKVYDWVAESRDVSKITFLGDSAGAGLVLGFTHTLMIERKKLPKQVIALSPWLDVSLDNPDIAEIENKDPLLSSKGLKLVGKAYAGEWNTKDPRISPIYGNFKGFPPITVFISTYDILYADVEKWRNQISDHDIQISFNVYPKLFHDWLIVPILKESQLVLKRLGELISE